MAKSKGIVIKQMGLMRIRSGWPAMIKDDCTYFNITLKLLAEESKLSPARIDYICNGIASYESDIERMNELTRLTLAFNRIIAKRVNFIDRINENNLFDTQ